MQSSAITKHLAAGFAALMLSFGAIAQTAVSTDLPAAMVVKMPRAFKISGGKAPYHAAITSGKATLQDHKTAAGNQFSLTGDQDGIVTLQITDANNQKAVARVNVVRAPQGGGAVI